MELGDLNEAQKQAVLHDAGPVLVVAGAGTGKTQVITRRVAYLAQEGKARPSEILALTFTDKAAAEMEERIDALLPYGVVDTQVMTFHSFGDKLLKEHSIEIGINSAYELMSKTQQIVFLKDHFDALELNYFAPQNSPDKFLEALVTYFSRLKEELIKPESYLTYATKLKNAGQTEEDKLEAAKHHELAAAYNTYVKLARTENLIDFGDQITLAIELLEKRPNVLKTLQNQIKYIMVDEFQDTNLAQNRLLEILAGKNGNIMAVGDDDQSIYKFRGAAISNILQFTQKFKDVKQIVLTQNYRSTTEILDSAYRLIQNNNPNRLEYKNNINKYLEAATSGPMPGIVTAASYDIEADMAAKAISARIEAGEDASEIAVLVRKRSQALVVIQALEAAGVPFRFSGKQSLYSQTEVELIFYFLRYLVDPSDSASLYHLLASDVYYLNLHSLMEMAATARRRNMTLESVLFDEAPTELTMFVAKFRGMVNRWRELSREYSVGQVAYDFLDKSGYLEKLTEESKKDPRLESKVRNLSKFFTTLSEFERVARDKSVLAYVLVLGALISAGEDPEAGDAETSEGEVQVMTVHKSKGLEFKTVYLFDMTKGAFPANRRSTGFDIPEELLQAEVLPEGDWHLQEERRLMYVAMTRAKENLVLSWSSDHGGVRAKQPSPFMQEALGIEPPKPLAKDGTAQMQQIELFKVETKPAKPTMPRFLRGEKLYLTPHQVDDYLTCPENFHYNYVLEVPQPPQPALMYGTLIHAVISQYYAQRRQGKADIEALLAMIPAMWKSDGFISKGQEERRKQQAFETIRRFVEREDKQKVLPKYNEKDFQFELPEHNIVVKGRFDAVYETGNGVVIRDYKTSQVEISNKASDKAKSSVQLAIYALAWQKMTGVTPVGVELDFVETGQIGRAIKTEADLAKITSEIVRAAKGIRARDFKAGKTCFYCSHRKVELTYA